MGNDGLHFLIPARHTKVSSFASSLSFSFDAAIAAVVDQRGLMVKSGGATKFEFLHFLGKISMHNIKINNNLCKDKVQ